jgi:DNA invertase Pin-like site-specific DNA recombinase
MEREFQVLKPIKGKYEGENYIPNPKKKVAAYARVSTDYEDQINSYRVQCEEYTKVIKSNPDYIFVGIYADQGLSGTQAKKRPEFMKMIEAARNGEIDLILTKSISRFGRNTVDVISYIRELREIGVEIFFEKENISSLDPKIDFMLTILSSIAQEESRSISSNVKWSYDKKFKKGIVDPRRIYGYDVVDGEFVVIPEEAKVIREIFDLALKRYRVADIVKILNQRGIKTLRGANWANGSLRYILSNERYVGDAILRKTVTPDYLTGRAIPNDNIETKYYVKNNHEPIVDREIFNAVQVILKSKSKFRNTNKTSKYPLTGILYCPKCHRTLKRQYVNPKTNKRVVLNCNHSYGNNYICKTYSPDYNLVLNATIKSVNELFSNKSLLSDIYSKFESFLDLENLRKELSISKEKVSTLLEKHHENPEYIDTFNEYTTSSEKLKVLEEKLVLHLTSSYKLDFFKSLESLEHIDETNTNLKDIYSLILADDKKITFVISQTKSIDELVSKIDYLKTLKPILSNIYLKENEDVGIYYEVIIYE